jgi:hypothetical protein
LAGRGAALYGSAVLRDWRSVFGLLLVLAVVAPVLRPATADSYPLSTYPMFARVLDKPRLTVAEGVTEAGRTVRLPPEMVANDEPMQAMRTLRLSGNRDLRERKALCRQIASRVAATLDFSEVTQVRIVRAQFDPLRYFEGVAQPERAERLVQCPVKRGS